MATEEESLMRSRPNPQRSMLAIVDMEERVSQDHPLWRIKEVADAALAWLSPTFDRMYVRGEGPRCRQSGR